MIASNSFFQWSYFVFEFIAIITQIPTFLCVY